MHCMNKPANVNTPQRSLMYGFKKRQKKMTIMNMMRKRRRRRR